MKIEDVEYIFKTFKDDKYIAFMTPLGAITSFKNVIVQKMKQENEDNAFKRQLSAHKQNKKEGSEEA